MPSFAATATRTAATHSIELVADHTGPSGGLTGLVLLALAALAVTSAGYLAWCWLSPFTHCPHHPAAAWRCRRCDGTHLRLRAGRVFLNWLRATRGRAR